MLEMLSACRICSVLYCIVLSCLLCDAHAFAKFVKICHCRFKSRYEGQIVAGNDKHASDRMKRLGAAVAQVLFYLCVSIAG